MGMSSEASLLGEAFSRNDSFCLLICALYLSELSKFP